MSEGRIRLVLLWHMHQPYYKDLVSGVYRLPWVRLHALKDYYGMVAMLEEFPRIHQNFNLVPSLVTQLEDYVSGSAREPVQDLAYKPTADLTTPDRLFILRYFFQANLQHLISRYSRYRELFDRMQASEFVPEKALPFFRESDLRDLQVLSQLAWFDEIFLAADAQLKALVNKAQGYTHEDQQLVREKQQMVIGKVIGAYRLAAERGQVELSTTPFYHPILPLVCDTNVAVECHPGVRLPNARFRHPEDARMQLQRAIELHQRVFGHRPVGLWPSEGSVSPEALGIAAELGFRWAATDQQVLSNSTGVPFFRDGSGVLANADRLYAPYQYATAGGDIQLFFRDHELSDRIGFVYSHMDAEAAANDLVWRIKHSASPITARGGNAFVPIILDGENAWEYYRENGRPFLKALYRLLSDDPQIECLTASEAMQRHGRSEALHRLVPGSWINANFDVWIGADEDNQAWDHLSRAREFYDLHHAEVPADRQQLAMEELMVAEGSDWCWWYGPEHSTANDVDFDAIYRLHLANVYHALGYRPPETLANPITGRQVQVNASAPANPITANIDGVVSTYFEWMGAGVYTPVQAGAAMHGGSPLVQKLHFGRDTANFVMRLDLSPEAVNDLERVTVRLMFNSAGARTLAVSLRRYPESCVVIDCDSGRVLSDSIARAVLRKVFEVSVSLSYVFVHPEEPFHIRVAIWENDYPRETLPPSGWLTVPSITSESSW